jgi:hypothetical protein
MKLPDLPDMVNAGMGLTEALAFWNYMMNTPGHPAEYWWARLTSQTCADAPGVGQVLH